MTGSEELLSKLKQLYDSEYKAKVVKGSKEDSVKPDIKGVICNFIAAGSKSASTSDSRRRLNRLATSGMYRRSWILDVPESDIEKNEAESEEEKCTKYISELDETLKNGFIQRLKDNPGEPELRMKSTDGFKKKLEEIDQELINRANEDKLDEFKQYDSGSLDMILNLSYIIGVLEYSSEITEKHLEYAFNFFLRTRESAKETFQSVHPYKIMYNMLSKRDQMTLSEMAEIDDNIPIAKTKVADNISMLEELCYRKDKMLKFIEGKVIRYSIQDLPENDLTKIILSIDSEHQGKFAINYKPFETQFFGGKGSVQSIVTSKKIDSFCACHFEPSAKAIDGHRSKEFYIPGENMLAFDIDDGMTIEEAKVLLSEYTYMIYTTSSHRTEKSDGEDRFRILIPTKTTFYTEPAQHKILYENVSKYLGLEIMDKTCTNAGRMFFTQTGKTNKSETEE